jgi:hypothetical protein
MKRLGMVITSVAALGGAAVASADIAFACSPLPPGMAEKQAERAASNVDKRKTSLVEAVVIHPARWPQSGTLRVTRAYWGKLPAGALLTVQPQPGSTCGPSYIAKGQKGIVQLRNDDMGVTPMSFYGFMKQHELKAYREKGLVPR